MNTFPNRLWFVIDDDLDDQEIFTLAAKNVDPAIECVFANDGVHAIKRLSNEPSFIPGSIFIDVNMPRMNGIECLEKLRDMDHLKEVPIFICSTSADPKIIAKAKELGARDFIIKPSTISEFAVVLAEVNRNL